MHGNMLPKISSKKKMKKKKETNSIGRAKEGSKAKQKSGIGNSANRIFRTGSTLTLSLGGRASSMSNFSIIAFSLESESASTSSCFFSSFASANTTCNGHCSPN